MRTPEDIEKLISIRDMIDLNESYIINLKESLYYNLFSTESHRQQDIANKEAVRNRLINYYNNQLNKMKL